MHDMYEAAAAEEQEALLLVACCLVSAFAFLACLVKVKKSEASGSNRVLLLLSG